MESFKIKTELKAEVNELKQCEKCTKSFGTDQGLKLHIGRVHKESKKINRELCENTLETREQIEKHLIIHEDINSPNAKKQKQSIEEMEPIEYTKEFEAIWKDLEAKS